MSVIDAESMMHVKTPASLVAPMDWSLPHDDNCPGCAIEVLLAQVNTLTRERDEARETKRELHRRTQQAESVAASVDGRTIAKMDVELSQAKVDRHKAIQENRFMKSERKRLQLRLAQERRKAMAAEARVAVLEDALRGALHIAEHPAKPANALDGIRSILATALSAPVGESS